MISVGVPLHWQTSLTSSMMASGQPLALREGSGTYSVGDSRVMVPGTSLGSSSVSPKSTGATVHHLGPADPRDSPFAHLRSQLQSVTVQDPARAAVSSLTERRLSSDSSSTATDVQACKRIKLEPPHDVSSSSSPLFYRTLYVNSREHELLELRSSYQDHITELFFLENSGNLMDYIVWSKRPNVHLSRLLQSASLDSTNETKAEDDVCNVCYMCLLTVYFTQPSDRKSKVKYTDLYSASSRSTSNALPLPVSQ